MAQVRRFLERGQDRLAVAEQPDEAVDGAAVGPGLSHAFEVELEVTDEATAKLIALFDEHDVVDQPAAAGRTGRYPREFDARQLALQGLQQGHEVPHREDVVLA